MLIKLFKHDFTAMGRLLAPIMAALLVISVVIGINVRTQYNVSNIARITIVLFLILFFLIFLAFFMTYILTFVRFRQNLLGNQGYLSFALPVSTAEHIISKFLASIAWTCINTLAAAGCFWIIFTIGIPAMGRNLGSAFMQRMFPDFDIMDYLTWSNFLMVFSTSCETVLHLYLSVSIGHLWQKHSVLGAVLAFTGLSILRSQLFFRLLEPMSARFSYSGFTIFAAFFFSILYAVFTWLILDRKLNLE